MIEEWEPDDLIALSLVWGLILLIATGYDSFLIQTFALVNGTYFGVKQIRRMKKKEGM